MVLNVSGGLFEQRDVRETATETLRVGAVPIGGIIPWAGTLTGVPALPSEFVRCDGQVLADTESLLNGTIIPDLNGDNRFMRGNSTSGGVGGSATGSHTHRTGLFTENTTGELWISALTAVNHTSNKCNLVSSVEAEKINLSNYPNGTSHFSPHGLYTDAEGNLPIYYNVVWVMRIK